MRLCSKLCERYAKHTVLSCCVCGVRQNVNSFVICGEIVHLRCMTCQDGPGSSNPFLLKGGTPRAVGQIKSIENFLALCLLR